MLIYHFKKSVQSVAFTRERFHKELHVFGYYTFKITTTMTRGQYLSTLYACCFHQCALALEKSAYSVLTPLKQSCRTWWRHQMETFSALLAICAGNSPVPGEFPAQRSVTRSFYVFFDLRPNKRLSKQSWGWWFETLYRPHYDCNDLGYQEHLMIPQTSEYESNAQQSRVYILWDLLC